jgi:hypothetical protein
MTFVFTSLTTAHDFFVAHRVGASHHLQNLVCSVALPGCEQEPAFDHHKREFDLSGITFGRKSALWTQLCRGLAKCHDLRRADIWLDNTYPQFRGLIVRSPHLFMFDRKIASKISINIPIKTAEELERLRSAIPPRVTVAGREWPRYLCFVPGLVDDDELMHWTEPRPIVHGHPARRNWFGRYVI